jgi:hypothetical protein
MQDRNFNYHVGWVEDYYLKKQASVKGRHIWQMRHSGGNARR